MDWYILKTVVAMMGVLIEKTLEEHIKNHLDKPAKIKLLNGETIETEYPASKVLELWKKKQYFTIIEFEVNGRTFLLWPTYPGIPQITKWQLFELKENGPQYLGSMDSIPAAIEAAYAYTAITE